MHLQILWLPNLPTSHQGVAPHPLSSQGVILTHRNILASSAGLVKGALPDRTIFVHPDDRSAPRHSLLTRSQRGDHPYCRIFVIYAGIFSPNLFLSDPTRVTRRVALRYISYLPMAHSFEVCMQICILIAGDFLPSRPDCQHEAQISVPG
jgi:hypothetical protein